MSGGAVDHIRPLQAWLRETGLDGIVVPSTDEYISEFAPPANRRLAWATGFRGSMGVAVVLRETAGLFLDGRYILQGAADSAGAPLQVLAATPAARRAFLVEEASGGRIGIAPKLHGHLDLVQWRAIAGDAGIQLEPLEEHPIDGLWRDRPAPHAPNIVSYPLAAAGVGAEAKCEALAAHVRSSRLAALLVGDPEDVSWLLNVRAGVESWRTDPGAWHVTPYAPSRAIVRPDGQVGWYVETSRLVDEVRVSLPPAVRLRSPDDLPEDLAQVAATGIVGADPRRTPAALIAPLEADGRFRADDVVARRRWRKSAPEIAGARNAHILDAAAVVRFMAWLKSGPGSVSELDAAEKLEALRRENPAYLGASMPLMSASGANGAMPHHVPLPASNGAHGARRTLELGDHPIYWMDSGGHYAGGSTDNTITVALGAPEPRHVAAHTLVLKGLLALTLTRFPAGTCGYQLDPIARAPMWAAGLDYAHGTGHGVGNCLNIHEGPSIGREPVANALVPLEPGMIVSNEPGYYLAEDFGLRLETHMLVTESRSTGFLEFETISRLPLDPDLVDFERLSRTETRWLADYHALVFEDLDTHLDAGSTMSLDAVVSRFRAEADAP